VDSWKRCASSSVQRLRSKREARMAATLSERRSGRPSTNRDAIILRSSKSCSKRAPTWKTRITPQGTGPLTPSCSATGRGNPHLQSPRLRFAPRASRVGLAFEQGFASSRRAGRRVATRARIPGRNKQAPAVAPGRTASGRFRRIHTSGNADCLNLTVTSCGITGQSACRECAAFVGISVVIDCTGIAQFTRGLCDTRTKTKTEITAVRARFQRARKARRADARAAGHRPAGELTDDR
jgi:hypothetical protein